MAVSESQLEIWSHQGSIVQSSDTYQAIKNVLEASGNSYPSQNYEVFLQGSYGNDTNIYGESDVDVVIRFDTVFYYDLSLLPSEEASSFMATHSAAPYVYQNFKDAVIRVLANSFGRGAVPGKRAIKITPDGNRRKADVLVATQYRRYRRYAPGIEKYDLGICFFNDSGTQISNYPKHHGLNCTAKHQGTNMWFKPSVRIIKNIREKLIETGSISREVAPSYFLEGLLYNVPVEKFGRSYGDTIYACVNWILGADSSGFVCANQQHYLLGDHQVNWPVQNYQKFLLELKRLLAS